MATANTAAGTPRWHGDVDDDDYKGDDKIDDIGDGKSDGNDDKSDGNPYRWHPRWHGGADDDDDNDDESDGNPYSTHGIGGVEVDADERISKIFRSALR